MPRSPTRGPAGPNVYKAACPEPQSRRSSSAARPAPQALGCLVGYCRSVPAIRVPTAPQSPRHLYSRASRPLPRCHVENAERTCGGPSPGPGHSVVGGGWASPGSAIPGSV